MRCRRARCWSSSGPTRSAAGRSTWGARSRSTASGQRSPGRTSAVPTAARPPHRCGARTAPRASSCATPAGSTSRRTGGSAPSRARNRRPSQIRSPGGPPTRPSPRGAPTGAGGASTATERSALPGEPVPSPLHPHPTTPVLERAAVALHPARGGASALLPEGRPSRLRSPETTRSHFHSSCTSMRRTVEAGGCDFAISCTNTGGEIDAEAGRGTREGRWGGRLLGFPATCFRDRELVQQTRVTP
mmetsp:Transcript_3503/g.8360  ORF Transcript_3503/g.8360 Transcript_3503/m.8360 type:complete len:245 (+) Transcript_3503:1017-1751(+)